MTMESTPATEPSFIETGAAPDASRPLTARELAVDGFRYTLRSLDESEIASWAIFCASVFAYKANPPPPSYFERHYWNDPQRDAALIRVAVCRNSEEIVASCRVFRRQVYLPTSSSAVVSAGGIGEVCTAPEHRRRGLSKALLQDALQFMQRPQYRMTVSLLHSAPSFFPVYESAGYKCTETPWSVVPFWLSNLPPAASLSPDGDARDPTIRHARFPQDASALRYLYHRLHSQHAGCLVRSEEYWTSYLGREWEGSLWVLEDGKSELPFPPLRGWMCVRRRECVGIPRLQVCDFGYRDESDAAGVLAALLVHACRHQPGLLPTLNLGPLEPLELVLPAAAAEAVRSSDVGAAPKWLDWSRAAQEVDRGWMYRPLDDSEAAGAAMATLQSRPLLLWPADSF